MDKTKNKSLLEHPLLIGIFTLFSLLIIFSLKESAKKATLSKESLSQLEESVEIEEKNLAKETEKLKNAQTELNIEKIKRNELLQKKEGEIILQIPEKENDQLQSNEREKINNPQEEWKKLLLD